LEFYNKVDIGKAGYKSSAWN